jgi:hypothetical protein
MAAAFMQYEKSEREQSVEIRGHESEPAAHKQQK